MQAPSSRVGLEGFSITFPELKISCPRIHFPHVIRSHSEARMLIDGAQAPYVRTGYQLTGPVQAPAPREAPPETCEEQLRTMQEKYDRLEQRAAQLEQLLQQNRDVPPTKNPAPLSPLQAPKPTADPAAYQVSMRLGASQPSPAPAGRQVSYIREPAPLLPNAPRQQPIQHVGGFVPAYR